jgi:hypothetical protein
LAGVFDLRAESCTEAPHLVKRFDDVLLFVTFQATWWLKSRPLPTRHPPGTGACRDTYDHLDSVRPDIPSEKLMK